jgi:hypothetical protein
VKERKTKAAGAIVAKEQAKLIMPWRLRPNARILTSQATVQTVLLLKGKVFADLKWMAASASSTS